MRHRGFGVLTFVFSGIAAACTSSRDEPGAAPLDSAPRDAGTGGGEASAAGGTGNEGGSGGTDAPGGAAGEPNGPANGAGGSSAGGEGPEVSDAGEEVAGPSDAGSASFSDVDSGSFDDGGYGGDPSDAGVGGMPNVENADASFERQHLLLDEGFESDDPFAAFSVGQACCDHTITASTEQARDGRQSFRAEVRVGDPAVSAGYRAELTMPELSDVGDKWYGFAVFFESPTGGDVWTGTNGHFVQWHPENSGGSASLGLWSYGDGWLVGLNPEGDSSAEFESLERPIEANRWHDVVLHVDWSTGIVQFWLNGVSELDESGVDFAKGPGQYMKLGINRWGDGPDGEPTADDWVIFYDSFRIGDERATYADVAP
jgi:hypothetical protein